jgi:hypothetical protein
MASAAACTAPNPAYVGGEDATRWDSAVAGPDAGKHQPQDASARDEGRPTPLDAPPAEPDASSPTKDVGMDSAPVDTASMIPAADGKPSEALAAHWPFDQTSASAPDRRVVDRFGNEAILQGGVAWRADSPSPTIAGSIEFDGSSGAATLNLVVSGRPTSTGAKTIAYWWKRTAPSSAQMTMMALRNVAGTAKVGLQLGFNHDSGASPAPAVWRVSLVRPDLETLSTLQQWHHTAYVYENDIHVLYLDGVERSRNLDAPLMPGDLNDNRLGTWNAAGAGRYRGFLADLRIYNTALSPADVRALAGL